MTDSDESSLSLGNRESSDGYSSSAEFFVARQGLARESVAAMKVQRLIDNNEHLALNETETKVSQAFVLDTHVKAIATMTKTLNCAVSIGESGGSTLRCLRLGAAAKGHDILEKTIKGSSVKNAYPHNADEVMKKIEAAKIDGYVGHWDSETGYLKGLYVGPEAKQIPAIAAKLKDNGNKAHPNDYYAVDINNLEESLKELKTAKDWQSIPFTGDYDLHDMLSFVGQPRPVGQGSEEERKILFTFNAVVGVVDKESRPATLTHKNVVRHGPQQNFIAHMKAEEGEQGPLVGAVAKPSYPLAMCSKGEWSIIENHSELKQFYKDNKVNLKSSWANPDAYFADQGDGMVTRQRSFEDKGPTRSN